MNDWPLLIGLPLWVWLFVVPALFGVLCFALGPRLKPVLLPLWRLLDGVYFASGVIAAFFMVMILSLIVAGMVARWISVPLPGTTEFAGYAMAATSFFALAHALRRGAHIRVSIVLNATPFLLRWLDVFAVFGAAVIATYFARFAVKANVFSEMLNDRTQGQDQLPVWLVNAFQLDFSGGEGMVYTPIWIPQLAMSFGTILLAVALWDTLYRMLVTGVSPIVSETVE